MFFSFKVSIWVNNKRWILPIKTQFWIGEDETEAFSGLCCGNIVCYFFTSGNQFDCCSRADRAEKPQRRCWRCSLLRASCSCSCREHHGFNAMKPPSWQHLFTLCLGAEMQERMKSHGAAALLTLCAILEVSRVASRPHSTTNAASSLFTSFCKDKLHYFSISRCRVRL